MALYAISDLHLSINQDKPMDIFGDNWINHDKKIKKNWENQIKNEDTVIIPGDISWSMKLADGLDELNWIHDLPGNKIFVKGNHDYWWKSINKLNKMYEDMNFIQNNYFTYEDYAICGTRGWICKGSEFFEESYEKIYKRELIRLRLSLESAKKAGYKKIIGVIHYPPTNEKFERTEFIEMFEEYSVLKVLYGHIHNAEKKDIFSGTLNNVEYIFTSCDYLDFNPLIILE